MNCFAHTDAEASSFKRDDVQSGGDAAAPPASFPDKVGDLTNEFLSGVLGAKVKSFKVDPLGLVSVVRFLLICWMHHVHALSTPTSSIGVTSPHLVVHPLVRAGPVLKDM